MRQAATKPAKRAATYADLVAASDLLIAEIIFGRLVTHRRGDPRHWACEVMSPETERCDRGEKRIVYAKAGVRHLWLVDTVQRTLEAFELKAGRWSLLHEFSGDAEVAVPPFAEITFTLDGLFHLYPPPRGTDAMRWQSHDDRKRP